MKKVRIRERMKDKLSGIMKVGIFDHYRLGSEIDFLDWNLKAQLIHRLLTLLKRQLYINLLLVITNKLKKSILIQ